MAWVAALLLIGFVLLPAAGYWISRRPVPPDSRRARGYGEVDRWLATEYGLDWLQRSRVQQAVARGRPVAEPALLPAARGLAERVMVGQFRSILFGRLAGWYWIVLACCFGAWGIAGVVAGQWVFLLMLAEGILFGLLGLVRLVFMPRRMRRNAARLLLDGR